MCKYEQLNKAEKIMNQLQQHDLKPDIVTYNTIISGYGKSKRKQDVEKGFSFCILFIYYHYYYNLLLCDTNNNNKNKN